MREAPGYLGGLPGGSAVVVEEARVGGEAEVDLVPLAGGQRADGDVEAGRDRLTEERRQIAIRPVGVPAALQAVHALLEPSPLLCGVVLVVTADNVGRPGGGSRVIVGADSAGSFAF